MKKKSLVSELPVGNIILEDDEYQLEYREELKSAEETINEDLKEQPSKFAWYAVLQELIEAILADAKLDLELVEATLDAHFRDKAIKTKEKITEKDILSKIKLHEEYLKARTAVNEAKRSAGVLKAIKESFAQRKDIVLALASNMRAQQDVDVFIKKEKHKKNFQK